MKETRVKLKSFLGTTAAAADVDSRENYWQLIGQRGRIIDTHANDDGRVLVLFEADLHAYRLENHNPIKNSLWILLTDLIAEE